MLHHLARPVVLVAALMLAPSVLASAQAQFKLNFYQDESSCWADCTSKVVNTLNLPGRDTNDVTFITKNCQWSDFLEYMSACLPVECQSAPDAAYAVEYGKNHCRKAGVDISNFTLPQSYLEEASEYFTSSEYTSDGARERSWGAGWLSVVTPLVLFVL